MFPNSVTHMQSHKQPKACMHCRTAPQGRSKADVNALLSACAIHNLLVIRCGAVALHCDAHANTQATNSMHAWQHCPTSKHHGIVQSDGTPCAMHILLVIRCAAVALHCDVHANTQEINSMHGWQHCTAGKQQGRYEIPCS